MLLHVHKLYYCGMLCALQITYTISITDWGTQASRSTRLNKTLDLYWLHFCDEQVQVHVWVLQLWLLAHFHHLTLVMAASASSLFISKHRKECFLKALDTFSNCQRPVFSLGVSQKKNKITSLWKFELNWSPKLWQNNERKKHTWCTSCVLSDAWIRDLSLRVKFN